MAPGSAVLHTEASRGFGGQEIRILAESRWLATHGWRALIAAQPGTRLLAEAERAGVAPVAVRMRGPWSLLAVAALRRVIRANDVAVVHTHSSIDAWVAGLAARSLGVPAVRGRHVSIRIPPRRALVYRLADRVITSGEAVAAIVRGAGVPADRVVAIGPGLDTARFHPNVSGAGVREELGLRGPAVGLVANIRGSKGHEHFLEAARLVLAERSDARFLIVGDGIGFEDVRRRGPRAPPAGATRGGRAPWPAGAGPGCSRGTRSTRRWPAPWRCTRPCARPGARAPQRSIDYIAILLYQR